MAFEEFVENLRFASQLLPPPRVNSGRRSERNAYLGLMLDSIDLWLTPRSVQGFDVADFTEWPENEQEELASHVGAFLEIAAEVPADKPAGKAQSRQARRRLERIIAIVRPHVLHDWLEAQKKMIGEAAATAEEMNWYSERDEKEVQESLLGRYRAPRLRIRTPNNEVLLEPIARFGSGNQGVVDLVIMPTYEAICRVSFQDGRWTIVSPQGRLRRRRFSRRTLADTIARLSPS